MTGFLDIQREKKKQEVIKERIKSLSGKTCVFVVIVAVRRKTLPKHNFVSLQTCFISFLRFCYDICLHFLICVLFLWFDLSCPFENTGIAIRTVFLWFFFEGMTLLFHSGQEIIAWLSWKRKWQRLCLTLVGVFISSWNRRKPFIGGARISWFDWPWLFKCVNTVTVVISGVEWLRTVVLCTSKRTHCECQWNFKHKAIPWSHTVAICHP